MQSGQKLFIMIIIASAILGSIVLVLDKNYRVDKIIKSNQDYYPSVPVDPEHPQKRRKKYRGNYRKNYRKKGTYTK